MSNNPIINKNISKILFKNNINEEYEELFFEAIHNGSLEKIKNFIEDGFDINTRDEKERNALFWAMYNRNFTLIQYLITLGIKTQVTPSLSAMNYAVYKNDVRLIKCLKNSGLNINEHDDVLSTPLIYAVLYNKLQSIDYLINNGACLNHKDVLGNSALSLAYDLRIEFLIKKFEDFIVKEA